jgi:hypothetical protein
MAICNALSAGINRSCDNNAGGLTNIYVADFENITAYTEVNSEITSITAGADFYEFEFNRGTSNYAESVNINLQNGTTFFSQTVTLNLARREKTKSEAIKHLTDGQKRMFVIVKDSNGLYWAFGKDEGVVVTAIEGGSGSAKADANQYIITFVGEEADNAPEVDPAIIAALLA